MTGVIEDLRALDSDRDSLLHGSIRVPKVRIGIQRPCVGVQRPHILPRSNLLQRQLQCGWGCVRVLGVHQNKIEFRFFSCASRPVNELLELRICCQRFPCFSFRLLCSCQCKENVRIMIDRRRLPQELNRVARSILSHANSRQILNRTVEVWKDPLGAFKSLLCRFSLARFDLNRRDLVGDPRKVSHLGWRCLRIRAIEKLDRALRIAIQHSQPCTD